MFRLMIKTHTITGKKYLCITKRDDYLNYKGSGSYWRKHLKKHGEEVETEVLFENENYSEFVGQCLFYSTVFNVALSDEYANLVPEHGYDNIYGLHENNLVSFWRYASDDVKRKIILKRSSSILDNHWSKNTEISGETAAKISKKSKKWWEDKSIDERRELLTYMFEGSKKFFENKDTDKYKKWKNALASATKKRMQEISFEEHSKMWSDKRLNMSSEAKEARAEKIRQKFAEGSWDNHIENMKTDRLGTKNPAARIYLWFGKEYTSWQFSELKIDKKYAEDCFNNRDDCKKPKPRSRKYEKLTCPYCGKSSDESKMPGTFKRWHFENCKNKKEKECI